VPAFCLHIFNTPKYISLHYVSCVNKTTCYKICKQNAGTKILFLFCLFFFYFFVAYKIILILPFVINYKKRQENCTRIQNNIITFYNWNCLWFYVEDTICEMEHDSNLKFNTCKPKKKRNKGQNKYNLMEVSYWS
jgi:hypothetical protein